MHWLIFLGQNEVDSLMVEGGGDVMATFMQELLINKLLWYIAPKIIGGSNARGQLEEKGSVI